METQFHTANHLIPKPPSLLGKQTLSQATLAQSGFFNHKRLQKYFLNAFNYFFE
jgi:hypothetical protein